ncbi:hypothetical protein [Nodularia sphaerocarpa]|uniref:hypothetical protein n=1 Tax=Nodularia sphaerocarpa TaxID=137816 RepID=UPI001EFA5C1F|nr:hypothetical protein [Nodularia sphaerocarpa]MDB9375644.1 hypothetical protein [Nodularia sphaerocarpa CS-585]ULP74035.1 hypothetical protein BDGGKGIB_03695 [Nodularia sphaerocarpa UHCC 0038]
MSVQTIKTGLMDLSIEEQEILSGGKAKGNTNEGIIQVDDAVLEYGGEEYPATITITVSDLPSHDSIPEEEEENDE